jgi:hypothetical protein
MFNKDFIGGKHSNFYYVIPKKIKNISTPQKQDLSPCQLNLTKADNSFSPIKTSKPAHYRSHSNLESRPFKMVERSKLRETKKKQRDKTPLKERKSKIHHEGHRDLLKALEFGRERMRMRTRGAQKSKERVNGIVGKSGEFVYEKNEEGRNMVRKSLSNLTTPGGKYHQNRLKEEFNTPSPNRNKALNLLHTDMPHNNNRNFQSQFYYLSLLIYLFIYLF